MGPEHAVPFSELYDEYVEWCKMVGIQPDTETALGAALTDRGFGKERRGRQKILYRVGLRLKPDYSPVHVDQDALQRAVDALPSVGLDERGHRLLCGVLTRWEQERVVYEDTAHEKLSAFVEDFKTRSGLSKMPDAAAQWLLLAWFVTVRGCEHVGENGDTVVMGARLRDQSDPQPDTGGHGSDGGHGCDDNQPKPCPPSSDTYNICAQFEHSDAPELELSAVEPTKKSRRKQNPVETLDALDYSISITDNLQHIKERLPMSDTDLTQPTYELPDIEIPEPRPFSELQCVAIDVETTSLEPESGRILAIGWKDTEREHIWRLSDVCREPIRKMLAGERLAGDDHELLDEWETQLLRRFLKALEQSKPDILTGYNLYEFDLPYIIGRCEELGVSHPFTIWDYSMRVASTMGHMEV